MSSAYDVNVTCWPLPAPPRTSRALPWFCTSSEAFWSFSAEPGWKTSVVIVGTATLPSLTPELPLAGAWRTKVAWVVWPVAGFVKIVPGSATTTTGPLTESCCAAKRAEGSNTPSPLLS